MSGIYSVEDLLKLRASPLICRPPNLPPVEEWMGAPENSTKRPTLRSKPEETNSQTESFHKRPLILDGHQKKSTTDPDRIVLGPPRRSFASSNTRNAGKNQDESEDISNLRDRSNTADRLKNSEAADSKTYEKKSMQQNNGRYGGRQDHESRRRLDDDHGDFRSRRDIDRDRSNWNGREGKDESMLENEDSTKTYRRDTQSRGKLDQPWFKAERAVEQLEQGKKDGDRTQDWRRDRNRDRDRDRDWDRQGRIEADPEWMDSTEPEEPAQAHTQEEFQRWKEKMKAGITNNDTQPDLAKETTDISGSKSGKPTSKLMTIPDDSMDKFFARFTETKSGPEPKNTSTKSKTRFASLFSPPIETQPKQGQLGSANEELSPQPPSAVFPQESNADADQAGFARILEMLQTRSNNSAPANPDSMKPRTPLYSRDVTQPQVDPQNRSQPQSMLSLFGVEDSHQATNMSNRPPSGYERHQETRSPDDNQHQRQQSGNKDELLLNLLRQAKMASKPQPDMPQQHHQLPPPGLYPISDSANRGSASRNQILSPTQSREARPPMFDDMSMPPMHYSEEPLHREPFPRRPTNGEPPGFFDDPYMRQAGQHLQKGMNNNPPPPPGLPPGLAKPPGLEQMSRMPPGWGPQPQQLPPQQPSRQQGPPPGMPPPMRGGMPSSFGMAGMPPPPPPPPPPPQQQQQPPQPHQSQRSQQRKYTGEAGMPGFLPGMPPPPGLMNNGPPPPGFPPGIPQNYGRFQGNEQPPTPGGMGRAFMEMYGDAGRPGIRGNQGIPPGIR